MTTTLRHWAFQSLLMAKQSFLMEWRLPFLNCTWKPYLFAEREPIVHDTQYMCSPWWEQTQCREKCVCRWCWSVYDNIMFPWNCPQRLYCLCWICWAARSSVSNSMMDYLDYIFWPHSRSSSKGSSKWFFLHMFCCSLTTSSFPAGGPEC